MDQIARVAGVAVGTLYRHFPTKTDNAVKVAAGVLDADVDADADVDDSADVQRAHGALQSLIDASRADQAVRDDLSIDDFYQLVGILFGIVSPAPPWAVRPADVGNR